MTTADPLPGRLFQTNVRRYYLYVFLHNFQLWFSIWVLYLQRERGLSLTQVTLLDVPFWLVIVLAEAPTGAVADRWGRKTSLALGSAAYTAAILLFGVATSFWELLASYLIWGVASTLQSGADTALLYESLSADGRGEDFSRALGRAQAVAIVAGLLGSLVGPPLAEATNLAVPIVVSAAIAAPAVLVALSFREPSRGAGPRPAYRELFRAATAHIGARRDLRSLIGLRAVLVATGMAAGILVQPYLVALDVPVAQFGILTIPIRLLSIAGALSAHRVAARVGDRPAFAAILTVQAAALLALAAGPGLGGLALFGALRFCDAALMPLSSAYINRRTPDAIRATVSSFAQVITSMLLAVVEPSLGLLADRASLGKTLLAAGLLTTAFGGAALIVWWRSDSGA